MQKISTILLYLYDIVHGEVIMPEHGTLRPKIDEIRLALTQIEEQIDQSEKARLA